MLWGHKKVKMCCTLWTFHKVSLMFGEDGGQARFLTSTWCPWNHSWNCSAKYIIIFVSGTTMRKNCAPGLIKWPGILWLLCNNAGAVELHNDLNKVFAFASRDKPYCTACSRHCDLKEYAWYHSVDVQLRLLYIKTCFTAHSHDFCYISQFSVQQSHLRAG